MKQPRLKWVALMWSAYYCANFFWKLIDWDDFADHLASPDIALILGERLVLMGVFLWIYFFLDRPTPKKDSK